MGTPYEETNSRPQPKKMDIRSILNPECNVNEIAFGRDHQYQQHPCVQCCFCPPRQVREPSIHTWSCSSPQNKNENHKNLTRRATWPGTEHTGNEEQTIHACRPRARSNEDEEMSFIWYQRAQLGRPWRNVCESFNDQFPNSERRRLPGLQYKLYRFLKRRNYPSMRGKRQIIDRKIAAGEPAPALRVIEWTKKWYPWMGESKNPSFNRSSPPQDLP